MELKGVVSVVVTMVILFISTGNAVDEQCIQNCAYQCASETQNACFYRCIHGCLGLAHRNRLPFEDRDDRHYYYCKLGCSSAQCLKYGNDKLKVGNCLDHCAYTICNDKAPSSSPSHSQLVMVRINVGLYVHVWHII